jgi:hypothetical protein
MSIPSIRDVGGAFYWQQRHLRACESPQTSFERAVVSVCDGLTEYLSGLEFDDDGKWSDYVLAPALGEILLGVRGLLNGDLGRLDGGTVDTFLSNVAALIRFDLDAGAYTG